MECIISVILNTCKSEISWQEIKTEFTRQNFIKKILNFNIVNLSHENKLDIINKYIKNPYWNFEKINYASKAAGPLVRWIEK